jgi:hypothetical protein
MRLPTVPASSKRHRKCLRASEGTRTAPMEVRQRLLDAIYAGQPFRTILRDLGLTPNQVWGLTKTDDQWSSELETALMATRRVDLKHGTTPAYVRGCVCRECREHQRVRLSI